MIVKLQPSRRFVSSSIVQCSDHQRCRLLYNFNLLAECQKGQWIMKSIKRDYVRLLLFYDRNSTENVTIV